MAESAHERAPAPDFLTIPGGATDPRRAPSWQPSLFPTRDGTRVVSFEELSGTKVRRPKKERSPGTNRARAHRPAPGQQAFGFTETSTRAHAQPLDQVIWCDAPVAIAAHRMMAGLLDAAVIAFAVSLFLITTWAFTGDLLLTRHSLALVAGIAGVFALLYKTLWCMANADTPGMRWSHLRTVNFDGQTPERDQRFSRLAAECLSVLAIGLGLLWSLVDEEALTWHDHISRTFPTPYPEH